MRDLLANTATLSRDLSASDEQIGSLIDDLSTVTGSIADRDADVRRLIDNVSRVSDSLAARAGDLDSLVTSLVDVETVLNDLLEGRQGDIEASIDDLDEIATVLGDHRSELEAGLATFPAGLAPYHQLSAYGQWFQVRITVLCLANQTTCVDETIAGDTLGQLATGAEAVPLLLGSVLGFAAGATP